MNILQIWKMYKGIKKRENLEDIKLAQIKLRSQKNLPDSLAKCGSFLVWMIDHK